MFVATAMIAVAGPWSGQQISHLVRDMLGSLDQVNYALGLRQMISVGINILMPVFLFLVLMAFVPFVIQGGIVFSLKVLKPDWERLNPLKRFKQVFFSAQALVELAKGLLKVGILSGLCFWYLSDHLGSILALTRAGATELIHVFEQTAIWITGTSALCMTALAVADKAYVRWDLEKRMKMTRQEVRDEQKNHEGDPAIKNKRRQRHREFSINRVLAEVPEADVVLTNPTHFAVALRYDRERDASPRVTAKGMDLLALKIRSIARMHGVPVMENKPLARGLYKTTKVGQTVRPELFQAVAQVYAFLFARKAQKDR